KKIIAALCALAVVVSSSGGLPLSGLRLFDTAVTASAADFEGDGSATSPYLIASAADWNALADAVNSGESYSGKYFKLTEDISVSTMIGKNNHGGGSHIPFSGTFDGDGHILTVNINSPSTSGAAPFCCVQNAVIRNLRVDGTVVGGIHSTGLVGLTANTVGETLLVEDVVVNVDVSGTTHHGGVIGHGHKTNITLNNVCFGGKVSASNYAGGLIGWCDHAESTLVVNHCSFAGTYSGSFHPVGFANNDKGTAYVTDFYTTAPATNTTEKQYAYPDGYDPISVSITAPTAKTGLVSDDDVELIDAGTTDKGTMKYSLDGKNFSEEIPKAGAGEHTVWYRVENGDNYNIGEKWLNVTVSPAPLEQYELWITGEEVTNKNKSGDGWSYDAATNTLTLNNYSFTGVGTTHVTGRDIDPTVIFYNPQGGETLNIVLEGENNIVAESKNGGTAWGIYSRSDFVISGDGTLNVSTADGARRSTAIYAERNLAITGGTINAASGTVTGNQQGSGIEGGSNTVLTIGESAVVTATGYYAGIKATVKNAIAGTGWSDEQGTEGKTNIDINTSGQDISTYKRVQFPAAAIDPTYTITIPATVNLKSTDPVEITASGVTLNEGQKIIVTLDRASNTTSGSEFSAKDKSGESVVSYSIKAGETDVSVGGTVAEFESSADTQSVPLNFTADASNVKYAGDHSEKLTFGVKLETAKTAAEKPDIAQADCTFSPSNGKSTLSNANITTAMEYSADNGTTWTDVTSDGSIASLAAGTVQIRVKETADKLASEAVSITVPEVLHFELVGPYTGDRLTCEYCAGETWQALVDRYDLIKAYRGHPAFGSDGFIYDEDGNWFTVTDLIDNTKTYEVQ
ncbi:MAG: hypothetical protein IJ555_06195, partial [Ruminococcus sp.]|nr:hypothetical protein [Ruminococcus sp.]